MAKFEVYHYDMRAFNCSFGKWNTLDTFGEFTGRCEAPSIEDYKKVALVESDNLGDVFRITNHIDSNWQTNDEVIETYGDVTHRSTSVGDIVIDLENSKRYLCASMGWDEI